MAKSSKDGSHKSVPNNNPPPFKTQDFNENPKHHKPTTYDVLSVPRNTRLPYIHLPYKKSLGVISRQHEQLKQLKFQNKRSIHIGHNCAWPMPELSGNIASTAEKQTIQTFFTLYAIIHCAQAAERTPGVDGSSINIASSVNKTMQMNEELRMQIEVQRKLHQQLEAQEVLRKHKLGSAGLEVAKIQLSELISKVSSECASNSLAGLEENPCQHMLQSNPAQVADCSVDSCLTSSEGSQKEQDRQARCQNEANNS
ncbi:hypothetical protein C4D60_Mb11t22520 [Musa balbisiana]|uniref:MYB-CC type transcription factor LHEQLE-containing domain-containing protein n=1 Tax=Musa balbisiana TaxID=52838 RepID=A0A4S8J631_MUSBA|nr:hypothetical protein C4D60_Mb11t22520 [Musa balbisiana]